MCLFAVYFCINCFTMEDILVQKLKVHKGVFLLLLTSFTGIVTMFNSVNIGITKVCDSYSKRTLYYI